VASKISKYAKGSIVYIRETYGANRGQVDTRHKYKIRSIGPKQCTLENVREGNEPAYYRNRGRNYYLHTREEAEANNARNNWSSYIWDWSQLLVPIGNEGWDPDFNF
jgi:hypothetical protein